MTALALFYPPALTLQERVGLVIGQALDAALDVIDFPEPAPRAAERELAVPFLPGMDGIEVTDARLSLRARAKIADTEAYAATENAAQGVFLTLPEPTRLRKVEIRYDAGAPAPGVVHRVVLRAATPSGTSLQAGPPLYAAPPFDPPGPMFPHVLGGMTLSELGQQRRLLTLPHLLGAAWLIQVATGNSPGELAPLNVVPEIRRVALNWAPRQLSVVLLGSGGEIPLWSNPEALSAEAGAQDVSFTALAQKELEAALVAQREAGDEAVTLPLRLRFDAGSAGAIEITERVLAAAYVVRPLQAAPAVVRLEGTAVPLAFRVPAGLTPASSRLQLTVKHLGRELNAGSPQSLPEATVSGSRVTQARRVASAVPLAARPDGSALQIASVRLLLGAERASEAVLELCGDVAGLPGARLGPPIVRQLEPCEREWHEFELGRPLDVEAGAAPLWLVLRVNKGELLWFASAEAAGPTLLSGDGGQAWETPAARLFSGQRLIAQVFDRVERPATPTLRLQRGAAVLVSSIPLTRAQSSDVEWSADVALPASAHALFAATQGGREALLALQSTSALSVSIVSCVLRYDPFAASAEED